MGAKSGQSKKAAGKSAGRKRLALILFGLVFVGLFVGFAVAEGIGEPSVPSGDVALVKEVPSDIGAISEGELKRSVFQQASQAGLKKTPKEGEKKFDELKSAALTELLNEVWILGEAEELDISLTPKQVATELAQIKKQNFPGKGAFAAFLKSSHFTAADVKKRVEIQTLSQQIQETINNSAGQPSEAEIQAYYEAEKAKQFTTGASRDVRFILNKDKAEVEKAKAALEKDSSPKSWKKVAAKYSSDPSTKTKGGLQPGITEQFVKGELKEAIFSSATGELVGPVKYEKNYVLVEVVKLNPEQVQPLSKEVESQITKTLTEQKQQEVFGEFVASFTSKWTARTFCASDFLTEGCSNFVGTGHPSTATPSCYEANPKVPPVECPAPVAQAVPALPGTVTPTKPKGEPFPQRPRPAPAGKTGVTETSTAPPTSAPPSGE